MAMVEDEEEAGASTMVLVEEGDTLWKLGESLGLDWRQLQSFNGLSSDTIYAGETLRVPPRPWLRRSVWSRGTLLQPLLVEPGDTAWDIAQRLGLLIEELQEVNSHLRLDLLFPGDVLYVPQCPADWIARRQAFAEVRARFKGVANSANATFFDVFPPQKDVDEYREKHRLLLDAMRHVESSFIMPAPTGDGGLSIGPLQISTDYHQDAWWGSSGSSTKYERCEEVEYAEQTAVNYWLRYCPWALEFGDLQTLARTHNGGPQFWYHMATVRYWGKVRRALKRRGYYKSIPELQPQPDTAGTPLLLSMHFPFPPEPTSLETSDVVSGYLPCVPPAAVIQDVMACSTSSAAKNNNKASSSSGFQGMVSKVLLDPPV